MSHAIRARRSLGTAAVVIGVVLSVTGPAAAAEAGTVRIDNRHLIVTGTDQADRIALRVPAADTTVLEVDFGNDGADETVKLADFGQLLVSSLSGDDDVRIDFGSQVQPFTVVDTGAGDDVAAGGSGSELFRTGNGNDVVDGNRGADTASLGNSADEFIWDQGDGSDVVEGGPSVDLMTFNGFANAEKFAATADGQRLRFTRDLGNIVMDTNDVEQVDLKTLGGTDTTTIGDLRGTDVRRINVDLAGQDGNGDGATDAVTVTGTARRDRVLLSGSDGTVNVNGVRPRARITNAEPADLLTVDTREGDDIVNSRRLAPGTIGLTIL